MNSNAAGIVRRTFLALLACAVACDASASPGSLATTSTLLPDGRTLVVGLRNGGKGDVRVENGRGAAASPSALDVPDFVARSRHTATVMPDGRVLIWGGVDATGRIEPEGAWFDPVANRFSAAPEIPLVPRAGHTATVLTDGRLLVTGGSNSVLGAFGEAELWDSRTGRSELLASELDPPRSGHSATL
ncbi:MAG TPA: kelch repeat-containing protein, partial [Tahibacter sp.]|nr:kelch repeat-containing protein [Tahibacter sp.]